MYSHPIVAHAVERPCVLDDEEGDPLRLIVVIKQASTDDHRDGVDNEEYDIKHLLMP